MPRTFKQWLDYIESVHPLGMDLKLQRISAVAKRLNILKPAETVITIAGTNGKGSTLRLLETALIANNYKVGATVSPHLHDFNERIRIAGSPVQDAQITEAFTIIEAAREDITLTYFEFATLAALLIIKQENSDIALLEVGLGGRLDATNIVAADIAVITTIGIDHESWLGTDREAIGGEKAGIFRRHKKAIISDPNPPESVLQSSRELETDSYIRKVDFDFFPDSEFKRAWFKKSEHKLVLNLPKTCLAPDNVLTALAVLTKCFPDIDPKPLLPLLAKTIYPGRLEIHARLVEQKNILICFDLAHNPQAIIHLKSEIIRRITPQPESLVCLFGTYADKNSKAMMQNLADLVTHWYLVSTEGERGLDAKDLAARATQANINPRLTGDIEVLLSQAVDAVASGGVLLVCGSFKIVSKARELLAIKQATETQA